MGSTLHRPRDPARGVTRVLDDGGSPPGLPAPGAVDGAAADSGPLVPVDGPA